MKFLTETENYRLYFVFRQVDSSLAQKIANFWTANGAIPDAQEVLRRAQEVAILAINNQDEVVGVSTAYLQHTPIGKYFLYRAYIRPQDRREGLMRQLALNTRDQLKAHSDEALGIAHVNENPKLKRPGMVKMFERYGYTRLGISPQGHDIWGFLFSRECP